ncbi:MAG: malonyl-CoA decarboxylase [Gammaproteobacteria bacterium]
MPNRWLERLLDSVADRGRELLGLKSAESGAPDVKSLCDALLSGRGEASNIALSREILRAYQAMDAGQRLAFFELLHTEYRPDPERIRAAAQAFFDSDSVDDYLTLYDAVEPPRQELLRRLNMAPQATGQLVAMRGELLTFLRDHPELKDVDADFKHLLYSWFNRGFLQIRRIDWQSPAEILEKLISYEAVHAIQGWDDLRRRLAEDRRCFAFFHPGMPDEPLIFVEVALVQGMSETVAPLLALDAPVLPLREADTAMFYSINNTQAGLRGVSFGNFLIKQVLAELRAELPGLERFATISPMPRFASTIRAAAAGERSGLTRAHVEQLLEDWAEPLLEAARAARSGSGIDSAADALLALVDDRGGVPHAEVLAQPLTRLALAYLTLPRERGGVVDPVAAFHLANGARLERIDPFADASRDRLTASFGVMVNYLYEPEEVEANHERFTATGEVAMSKALVRQYRQLRERLPRATEGRGAVEA